MDLVDILRQVFNDDGYIKGDEIVFFCPKHKHHKRKLCINLKTQKSHCWVCNLSARSIYSLFKKLNFDVCILKNSEYYQNNIIEEDNFFLDTNNTKQEKMKLPDEFLPLCYKYKSIFYNTAIEYLKKRNVDETIILRNKIGYCESGKYKNRIIFPSFDCNGDLNYFVARWFLNIPTKLKYINSNSKKQNIIFNELYLNFSKPIIICEGIFDSFVCGENSVPLLGSSIYENLLYKCVNNKCPEVFIAIDPDTYNFKDYKNSKLIKIFEKLLHYGIKTKFIDVRPYKDVAEMSKEEFVNRKNNAILIDDTFLFKIKIGEII